MNRKLYLECYSGISGDMTVAALLDLGADEAGLRAALDSMQLEGYQIKISRVMKSGLAALDFAVILAEDNHDHDMAYLHGHTHSATQTAAAETAGQHHHHHEHEHAHEHEHEHEHNHEHEHEHNHEHEQHDEHHDHHHEHSHNHEPEHQHDHTHTHNHNHEQHDHAAHCHQPAELHHHHEHRGLNEVLAVIERAQLTERAKKLAKKIFNIIAEAEAKAHGTTVDAVHFHEVGAVDSIVDVVAIAYCIDNLGIEDVIIKELYEGSGFVRCQHGLMPVPVPAVANIAAACGLKLHIMNTEGEFVTPTGAAAAAALRTADELPESFNIVRIGLGAGKRSYDRPSILRAMLLEESGEAEQDEIYKLESNIDDCTGEMLGFVLERLLEAGAKDVSYQPIYMKKNRPAYQLTVLCSADRKAALEELIFSETTTLGIRSVRMDRTILKRRELTVQTELGQARVKAVFFQDKTYYYPEYDSVTELCRRHKLSYQSVYKKIAEAALQNG